MHCFGGTEEEVSEMIMLLITFNDESSGTAARSAVKSISLPAFSERLMFLFVKGR